MVGADGEAEARAQPAAGQVGVVQAGGIGHAGLAGFAVPDDLVGAGRLAAVAGLKNSGVVGVYVQADRAVGRSEVGVQVALAADGFRRSGAGGSGDSASPWRP